jgi:uncharacterized lipoprotein YddW (UPF0748 family)
MRRFVSLSVAVLSLLLVAPVRSDAQTPSHYRAFWVDTFNTLLNNHADVVAVVDRAAAAHANAIFAQVRRRGDAWYLDSLEPLPDPRTLPLQIPIQPGFDPLAALIAEAHARGIEVHAFVIAGAIWDRNPTVTLHASPNHPFNLHGGYDPDSRTIIPGPDNWLTRTLAPDMGSISFQGHRFGADFWIDPGHPDAAAYTVDVLMHLVEHYDIDGLHLDRIRYPENGVPLTLFAGANVGYNVVNVERFQRRHGIASGSPPPAFTDPDWNQWRRNQVSNLVRRVYLNAIARKPQLELSASLIAFGGGPTMESEWPRAEAYWRVYQDWRAWTEEGILDLAVPMVYKREHDTAQAAQFDQWAEWTKNHAYNRGVLVGQGAFLNAIEGSLRQVRRALAPSAGGNLASGVAFFSMATPDALTTTPNPWAIPPAPTPMRGFAEFAAGLATGRSADGATLYEDPTIHPIAVFADVATVPALAWKTQPQVGHLKGFVHDAAGQAVDTARIEIVREDDGTAPAAGRTTISGETDGGGFYGGVDLAPGRYRVSVTTVNEPTWHAACTADVTAGSVADLDLTIDRWMPETTIDASASELWPPNGRTVLVAVAGDATDQGTGLARIVVQVIDEYGTVEPIVSPVEAGGAGTLRWKVGVPLVAARREDDKDGRTYTLLVTISDRACNVRTAERTVHVPHDMR